MIRARRGRRCMLRHARVTIRYGNARFYVRGCGAGTTCGRRGARVGKSEAMMLGDAAVASLCMCGRCESDVCTFASCIDTAVLAEMSCIIATAVWRQGEEGDEKGPRSAAVWRRRRGRGQSGAGGRDCQCPHGDDAKAVRETSPSARPPPWPMAQPRAHHDRR